MVFFFAWLTVVWTLSSMLSVMCVFFKQKTAYEMRISDWSSDVCSSDLLSDRKSRQNRRVQRLLRRGWWIWRAARWHGPAHCQRLSTHPPERSYRTREHHLSGSYAAPTDIFLGFPCNCRQKSAVLMKIGRAHV